MQIVCFANGKPFKQNQKHQFVLQRRYLNLLSKNKKDITDANTNIVKFNTYISGKQDEINTVSAGLNAGADAVMGALGGLSSVEILLQLLKQ